jgi:tRNA dimethylallyltransferase
MEKARAPLAPTPCVIGPTASGKSDVGEALARATNGEVIACDAYTVYRGMEILSAAPSVPPDVPHHLVRERDPSERWSAAEFAEACDALVSEIRARGRVPWIVGGTALYLRGWLKGFGAEVPRDPAFRAEMQRLAEHEGAAHLHGLLARSDPPRAAELHPNDLRRVVRALEIVHVTGRRASDQRTEWMGADRRPAIVFGMRRERADLEDRIRRRTDAMFDAGVVEEARALLAAAPSPEAAQVLGLAVLERLLAGEIDEAAAREEIARKTRRLARKQMTFFASFDPVTWIDVAPEADAETVCARVLATLPDQALGTSA